MNQNKFFSLKIIFIYILSIVILVAANIFASNYWSHQLKSDWKKGLINSSDGYGTVVYKTKYISQKSSKSLYNSFIFGGSKTGCIQPSYLEKFSNHKFYNYWTNNGCFENYELFINHILNEYNEIKEVWICLSSHEVEHFETIWRIIPSEMKKRPFGNIITEFQMFFLVNFNINTFIDLFKNRNKKNFEQLTNQDGSRCFNNILSNYNKNPNEYVNEKVYNYWHKNDGGYDRCIHDLFKKNPKLVSVEKNINSLIKINNKLLNRNIKLKLIIMPTFIGELFKYSSPDFEKYLKSLVTICNVYNFGGINLINLNPYNFEDGGHTFDFVGNKIIETIYSTNQNSSDMDAFGILLTKDNIDCYISSQRNKWLELKAEYEKNGTIKLQNKNDNSYLGK